MIIDPGASTNLFGANITRALVRKAVAFGHRAEQHRMTQPLNIQGVGHGSQQCRWEMVCPIAVPDEGGSAQVHTINSPMVSGSGEDLPGLLGLRSLEALRAILDTANRTFMFLGPGPIKIELPPGSTVVPLEKAPSGHLVMVIDDYEHVAAKRGGLPNASLALHTSAPSEDQPVNATSTEVVVPATVESDPTAGNVSFEI